jgi:DNA-binding XRE family transcriptional regulator
MKQEELSTAVGYGSRSSIVNIEQGIQMPPWDKALAIADYLHLPLEAFRQADIVFTQEGLSCRQDDVVMQDNKTVIVIEVKSSLHLVNHLYQALEYLKKRLEAAYNQ